MAIKPVMLRIGQARADSGLLTAKINVICVIKVKNALTINKGFFSRIGMLANHVRRYSMAGISAKIERHNMTAAAKLSKKLSLSCC